MFDARQMDYAVRETGNYLLWQRGRTDIPVMGPPPQQSVPDAAPHHIGRKPRPVQPLQYLPDGVRHPAQQVSIHSHRSTKVCHISDTSSITPLARQVSSQDRSASPATAVMVQLPGPIAVTTPSFTVATPSSELFQDTLPFQLEGDVSAVKIVISPSVRFSVSRSNRTEVARTLPQVTLQVAV